MVKKVSDPKDVYRHFFFFNLADAFGQTAVIHLLCVFFFVHLVFFYDRKTDMHVLKCLPIGAEH